MRCRNLSALFCVMRSLEQMSVAEIADCLEITEQAVKMRFRAGSAHIEARARCEWERETPTYAPVRAL